MITITPQALTKIHELKAEESLDESYFIRVSVVGGGCSGLSYNLDFDNEDREGDQVFESEGAKIVCDMKSFLYLCKIKNLLSTIKIALSRLRSLLASLKFAIETDRYKQILITN